MFNIVYFSSEFKIIRIIIVRIILISVCLSIVFVSGFYFDYTIRQHENCVKVLFNKRSKRNGFFSTTRVDKQRFEIKKYTIIRLKYVTFKKAFFFLLTQAKIPLGQLLLYPQIFACKQAINLPRYLLYNENILYESLNPPRDDLIYDTRPLL